jgi:excisionase family DNA binding protein
VRCFTGRRRFWYKKRAVEPLTIREAARRARLHPATVRRYIKQGRIQAVKVEGKFGEEYRIEERNLDRLRQSAEAPASGQVVPSREIRRPVARVAPGEALDQHLRNFVHLSVYNELMMKHEQLLVQFGMIRASGQKLLDFKAELDLKNDEIKQKNQEIQELKRRIIKEVDFLTRHLREAEIEIEDKNFQISVLRDKVRNLELILTAPDEADSPALSSSRPDEEAEIPPPADPGAGH